MDTANSIKRTIINTKLKMEFNQKYLKKIDIIKITKIVSGINKYILVNDSPVIFDDENNSII
jgi:hypothetical protein